MDIDHIEEGIPQYFSAIENSEEIGRIEYTEAGETKLIIDHTEVNPAYGGQGIGKKLVFAVVEYARLHNMKILPLCSFAKAVFDKTPEIRDVLF